MAGRLGCAAGVSGRTLEVVVTITHGLRAGRVACALADRYAGHVGRRRRRRPVVKVNLFRKAKWLVANGMPSTYIATRLEISRTTELRWRQLMNHDGVVEELRRRVLQLPERYRDQIVTAIQDARRAA